MLQATADVSVKHPSFLQWVVNYDGEKFCSVGPSFEFLAEQIRLRIAPMKLRSEWSQKYKFFFWGLRYETYYDSNLRIFVVS